ncbi:hypothetical protein HOLleu_07840 [Holothuria leucospilota]|uniref:Uncharacterized protein n=1 Tax=Holothuria leucospilota TaxID=206669 RepID=A0A9Q1HHC0_HOLLE|nr:hypothetical protein HOLleu_07840 [Holothuria leucospilota]
MGIKFERCLENCAGGERAHTVVNLYLDNLPIEHTLGVRWDVQSDQFGFEVSVKEKPLTRRGILLSLAQDTTHWVL